MCFRYKVISKHLLILLLLLNKILLNLIKKAKTERTLLNKRYIKFLYIVSFIKRCNCFYVDFFTLFERVNVFRAIFKMTLFT